MSLGGAHLPRKTNQALVRPSADSGDTKMKLFEVAEQLCAAKGLQAVSVRDITSAANANVAALNYHYGSKDDLLYEIFRTRTYELNRERFRLLDEALQNSVKKPSVRGILKALFAPSLRWLLADESRRPSIQFIMRARSEGTIKMRESLQQVSHLERFAKALMAARPDLDEATVYWRLHFCLGMVHNNREVEFQRLHRLSGKITSKADWEEILEKMLDFAEAGFLR
jgi:AcrR family transcriptional regulator